MSASLIVAHATLIMYALLLGVGGVMGFVKARSHASLVTGLLSAIAAFGAAALSFLGFSWGIALGAILAIGLFILFGYRYAINNRNFMPSGMLAVVSLVVMLVLLAVSSWSAS